LLATVGSATLIGVEGCAITVEVHVSPGLPQFTIVGLPDASCREARDRVRAAMLSSALAWPQRRVTVNLAPSDVRKGGTGLDLPIAVALLAADGARTRRVSPTGGRGPADRRRPGGGSGRRAAVRRGGGRPPRATHDPAGGVASRRGRLSAR
jgi:hypothetical protein